MKLALVMLISYIPFFWWAYKQARTDMKTDETAQRKAQYLSNERN